MIQKYKDTNEVVIFNQTFPLQEASDFVRVKISSIMAQSTATGPTLSGGTGIGKYSLKYTFVVNGCLIDFSNKKMQFQ